MKGCLHDSGRRVETTRGREELSLNWDQEDLAANDKKKRAEDAARRDTEDRAASKTRKRAADAARRRSIRDRARASKIEELRALLDMVLRVEPWNFVRHDRKTCAAWENCGERVAGYWHRRGKRSLYMFVRQQVVRMVRQLDRPTEGLQWKSNTVVVERVQVIAEKMKVDPRLESNSEETQGQQQQQQQKPEPDRPEEIGNGIMGCAVRAFSLATVRERGAEDGGAADLG